MTRKRKRGPVGGIIPRVFLATAVAAALCLAYEVITWPNVAALAQHNPRSTAFIERYESAQRADPEKPPLRWSWTPWTSMSASLKRAVVVAEDAEFFFHDGFSEREIRAAIEKAIERRELPRGASTITQQLAKNLWLSPSRNPLRKVEEALLTKQLEQNLTKRRILEIYLNVAEFGPGIYGAEAASRAYFGKSAAGLSVRESAALAASLPKPSKWHPGSNSRYYNRRAGRIERMAMRAGFLKRYVGGSSTEEVAVLDRERRERNREDEARRVPKPAPVQAVREEVRAAYEAPARENAAAELEDRDAAIQAEADTSKSLQEMMRELQADIDSLRREEAISEEDSTGDGA